MAWAFVQATNQGTGNGSGVRNLAYTSSVTAGDLLLVSVATFNTGTETVSVADSQGNIYSQIGAYVTKGSQRISLWMARAGSTAANTVNVTPSATVFMGIAIGEWSFASATFSVDATSTNTGSSTTPSTGSIAVNNASELAVAVFCQDIGNFTWTAGTGFTNRTSQPNASSFEAIYLDDSFPVSTAVNDQGTLSSSAAWAALGASIKATASATGGPWPWFFDSSMSGGCQSLGGM